MRFRKWLLSTGIACCTLTGLNAQSVKHVILISIDGLRPEFYLDDSWPAPNLRTLRMQGTYAEQLTGVFPTVTYPSHTTLVTGQPPGSHGIYYNAPFGAPKGRWYWEDSLIRVPTLWTSVRNAGLVSGAVMWPVTVGAPIHYNFPVRRPDGDENTDQLSVTRPYITPSDLLDKMGAETGVPVTSAHFKYQSIDQTIGALGAFIFKNYQPNLLAVHFIGADHEQHTYEINAPEVKRTVAVADSMIGVLMKAVKEAGKEAQTAFIIVGDHGFVNADRAFAPNVLLAKNGLIGEDDWVAKFNTVGGSAFLYTKQKNDREAVRKVKALLLQLPEAQRRLFRIVTAEELRKISANPEVDLALAMQKGVVANGAAMGQLVRKKPVSGAHGFYPDFHEIHSGFIVWGAPVKAGAKISTFSMLDVEALVSKLLDIPALNNSQVDLSGILK